MPLDKSDEGYVERLRNNNIEYEKSYGHKPYFTLTPEGARAFKDYFSTRNVWESGSHQESKFGAGAILKFLDRKLNLSVGSSDSRRSDTEALAALFGSAFCHEQNKEHSGYITLDTKVIEALSASEIQLRHRGPTPVQKILDQIDETKKTKKSSKPQLR